MRVERTEGEWYNSMPGTGTIYRLIGEAKDESNQNNRVKAVMALGETRDQRAVRTLVEICGDADPEIRMYAIEALYKMKSCRAVSALIDRLRDKSERPGTRRKAAAALAQIRSYSAIQELKERYSDEDEDPAVRSYIAGMLGENGTR
jgi:HEAT repeat protein